MDFRKNVILLFITLALLVVGVALVQMTAPEPVDARSEPALQENPSLLRNWLPIIFLDTSEPMATSTPPLAETATNVPTETSVPTETGTPTSTPTQTTTPTITLTPSPTPSATDTATPTPAPITPTSTAEPPTATATPPVGGGPELLVFDWTDPVELWHHGFPWDNPPMSSANGNWTYPINYAAGTLHFRAEIFSQPVAQNNMMQFCIWQYNNTLENCSGLTLVTGTPGNVVTWSQGVQGLWMKDGNSIDWVNPRDRYGAVIKNSAGLPVSDFLGWNWNGEDPYEWYPLNMRFTVIVIAPGRSFSGWDNYISD